MEFPYGHKARLSSGQGIKWTCRHTHKKNAHITSLCANRHFCLGVCVHICISASTNSHFAMYYRIWESGRVGKTREKEITASTLVACSPCFSHQHWPELTVDSAATCDDGEGRNGNCTSAYLILPFVKFLGQQKVFQWAKSPPPAQSFCPGQPQQRSGSGPD